MIAKNLKTINSRASYLNKMRKWYSWNKPAPLKGPSIIKIPKRFQTIV